MFARSTATRRRYIKAIVARILERGPAQTPAVVSLSTLIALGRVRLAEAFESRRAYCKMLAAEYPL
jgi:hypothetical protein